MNYSLSEEQRLWQATARAFAREEMLPVSLQRDAIADPFAAFDWDIIRKGSKLGFRTAVVSKQWGGHGIDFVTQALVMAELAKADSAITKTFSQCWKWTHLIQGSCTPEQQERFLRPFVEDDTYLLGQAGTEPNSGSDHRLPPEEDPRAGWRLKAEPVDASEGADWILNGEKCFIANGSVARLFLIGTRTNPNVPQKEGGTMFAVPVGTPGMRVGKVFNKSGWRFYQNAELIFENCRVPHANVVGEVNGGHGVRNGPARLFGDFELGANALGMCDAAVEMATQHIATHWPQNRYFRDNQTIQLKLSEMHMLTEALRSFVIRVAAEGHARSGNAANNAILLQNFATDALQRVTALNMDIHASAGVAMMHAGAEKLERDAVIWTHLAGDSVQRMKAVRK
ncbi:MAG TPA: acyl-CoA dehydrogenase family protein [Burkholderiales bacterium]|nr:acyl-CoA dehydrogenase family protein [Burkholderiales bacterium]